MIVTYSLTGSTDVVSVGMGGNNVVLVRNVLSDIRYDVCAVPLFHSEEDAIDYFCAITQGKQGLI